MIETLMKSDLSVFPFMNCAFGCQSKNLHLALDTEDFLISFIVLHFAFRSTVHFELIFLKGVKFVCID